MEYIVNVQSFKVHNKEWAPKELAILPLNNPKKAQQYIFKPPFSIEELPSWICQENDWLERNHLRIRWDDGTVPFSQLRYILRHHLNGAKTVYVKGMEKAKWLSRYVKNVQELEETMQCPALAKLKSWNSSVCDYHGATLSSACALQNVTVLAQFVKRKRPSLEKSMAIYKDVGNLSLMTWEDIDQLPKDFITSTAAHSMDAAWDKLKDKYENDADVRSCLKCRVHNHNDKHVLPMIKNCISCNYNSNIWY